MKLGCLEVRGVKHPVFNGENRIGRDVACSISIDSKALSKEHAVIEVMDVDNHLIYDLGSRNKTRLGKMILQPEVRYQLADGAKVHLADVTAFYRRLPNGPEEDNDSGSETGSESMLTMVEDSVIVPETPGPSKLKPKMLMTVQESPSSASDADSSFGFAGDKLKEKTKPSLDQSAVKQVGEGDSIFEAVTQCELESPDNKKLRPSTDPHKDLSDVSNDSIFEAETQCEETSFKSPIKSSDKNESRHNETQNEDIYEAETQCVLNDTVKKDEKGGTDSKTTKPADKEKPTSKDVKDDFYNAPTQCFLGNDKIGSSELDAVSSCSEQTEDYTIDENSLSSNEDVTNKTEVGNTTCIEVEKFSVVEGNKTKSDKGENSGSGDKLQDKDKDQTKKEKVNEALNVSQNEDSFDRSLLEGDDDFFDFDATQANAKNGAKKSSELKEKTDVDSDKKEKGQVPTSSESKSDATKSAEAKNSTSTKHEMTVSVSSKSEKEAEKMNYSRMSDDMFLSQPLNTSVKRDLNAASSPKANRVSADMNKSTKSLHPTDSGDETDPDDIFGAPTQPSLALKQKDSKTNDDIFEAPTQRISPLKQKDSKSADDISEVPLKQQDKKPALNNGNKSSAKEDNDSGDETDPEDIFEAETQNIIPESESVKPSATSELHKTSSGSSIAPKSNNENTKSSVETKKADEDDDIFDAPTQLFEPVEVAKPKELPQAKEASSSVVGSKKDGDKDKGKISENKDKDKDSGIFQAPKQILQVPSKDDDKLIKSPKIDTTDSDKRKDVSKVIESPVKSKEMPKLITLERSDKKKEFPKTTEDRDKSKESSTLSTLTKVDDDDDIFEAATQIIPTPSKSALPSEKPSEQTKNSSPSTNNSNKQVPAISHPKKAQDKDDISEALTQKVEVPTRTTETIAANATVNSSKPVITSPSNHVNNKEQDSMFKTPVKAKELVKQDLKETGSSITNKVSTSSNAPLKTSSADLYDDDDFFDAPTQRIVEKPPSSGKELHKGSKNEQQDQKTEKKMETHETKLRQDDEGSLKKDGGGKLQSVSSKETKLQGPSSVQTKSEDIYSAATQIISSPEKDDQKDRGAKVESKSDDVFKHVGDDDKAALKVQKDIKASGIETQREDGKKYDLKEVSGKMTSVPAKTAIGTETPKKPADTPDQSMMCKEEKKPETLTKPAEIGRKSEVESMKNQSDTGSIKDGEKKSESFVSKTSTPIKRPDVGEKKSESFVSKTSAPIKRPDVGEKKSESFVSKTSTPLKRPDVGGKPELGKPLLQGPIETPEISASRECKEVKAGITEQKVDAKKSEVPLVKEPQGATKSVIIKEKESKIDVPENQDVNKTSKKPEKPLAANEIKSKETEKNKTEESKSLAKSELSSFTVAKSVVSSKNDDKGESSVTIKEKEDGKKIADEDIFDAPTQVIQIQNKGKETLDIAKVSDKDRNISVRKDEKIEKAAEDTNKTEGQVISAKKEDKDIKEDIKDEKRAVTTLEKEKDVKDDHNVKAADSSVQKSKDSSTVQAETKQLKDQVRDLNEQILSEKGTKEQDSLLEESHPKDQEAKTKSSAASEVQEDSLNVNNSAKDSSEFKTPIKKSSKEDEKQKHEKSDKAELAIDDLNDSMDFILPESQELRAAAAKTDVEETLDTSIEQLPSEDEELSPVITSKHLPVKKAKVRKRLELPNDEEKVPSRSSRRNAPENKSTTIERPADTGVRSSRRRKQPDEPVESSASTKTGARASKQRKLSEKVSGENEKNVPSKSDKEKTKAIKEKDSKKSASTPSPAKRQSRTSGSSQKQPSKIPKKERVSRNKTEDKKENEGTEKSSETPRTSSRRGQAQAGTRSEKQRSTRESRNARKMEDAENVSTASIRPSRERKMTWKVRESLSDSSQGSIVSEDDKSKSRSRGSSGANSRSSSSLDTSTGGTARSRNSTPVKLKVKNTETKVESKATTRPSSSRKAASQSKDNTSTKIPAPQTPMRGQKRKNEEEATETPVKRSRREKQDTKSATKEPDTRMSSRRGRQTSGQVQVQPELNSSTTTRSTRKKGETPVQSPSCLKELNTAVKSGSSARQQRGTKRANTNIEEELPAKQRKQDKTASVETPKEVEPAAVRSSRSRGKGTPQKVGKQNVENSVVESTKPTQRARSSRSSKIGDEKEDKTESLTPKSSVSEEARTPSQRSRATRGKGTPQSINQKSIEESSPRRATPRKSAVASRTTYKVMFTGFSDAKQEVIVKQLGGSVVDTPESCTVLVTDKVRRTFKFLCIMGLGKPIVSPEWLVQCRRSGNFIDPWQYIVKDQESETKYNFQLQHSLELAARTNLLAGYSVHVTPKVKPPPSEMKGIIESCGGTYMAQAPNKAWPASSFTISCAEDKSSWSKLKKSGRPILGPEVLLLGVLQQKIDLKSNTLV